MARTVISHLRVDPAVVAALRGHKVVVFQNLDLHAPDFGKLFFVEYENAVPVSYPAPELRYGSSNSSAIWIRSPDKCVNSRAA